MKRLTLISLSLAAGLLLAFAVTGCGGSDATAVGEVPAGTSPEPSGSDPDGEDPGDGTKEDDDGTSGEPEPAADVKYRVWFVRGEGLYAVNRTHEATRAVGAASLSDLLEGPSAAERSDGISSAVPDGTRLLGLAVSNGIAVVDLSSEYESGGGTLSMTARLGQVICTLDQFPSVQGVNFKLDGEPVEVFSGQGIILDKPATCADYEELLPVIVVESPAPGAEIRSGAKVTGTANVFEANVLYELVVDDTILDDGFTTATCGTGCRGDYSFKLRFAVDEPTDAILIVHDSDAAGVGKPPHEVRVPVTLLPS